MVGRDFPLSTPSSNRIVCVQPLSTKTEHGKGTKPLSRQSLTHNPAIQRTEINPKPPSNSHQLSLSFSPSRCPRRCYFPLPRQKQTVCERLMETLPMCAELAFFFMPPLTLTWSNRYLKKEIGTENFTQRNFADWPVLALICSYRKSTVVLQGSRFEAFSFA